MRKDDLYLKSVRAGKSLGRYLVGKSRAEEEREAESWKSGHGEETARMVSCRQLGGGLRWFRPEWGCARGGERDFPLAGGKHALRDRL